MSAHRLSIVTSYLASFARRPIARLREGLAKAGIGG